MLELFNPSRYPIKVRSQLIYSMAKSLQGIMPILMFFVPLPTVILLMNYFPPYIIGIWLITGLAIDLSRYKLAKNYLNQNSLPILSIAKLALWEKQISVVYLLSGIRWAVVILALDSSFSIKEIPIEYQILTLLLALSTITGLLLTASMLPITFLFYAVPIIVAVCIPNFAFGTETGAETLTYILYLAVIIYFLINFFNLRSDHAAYVDSITFKFKNDELIEGLKKKKEEKENLIQNLEEEKAVKETLINSLKKERITKEGLILRLKSEKSEAEAAHRRTNTFLASASHDIRQPVQSLEFFVQSLNSDLPQEETIEKIRSTLSSLSLLLDNLLDISKLEADIMKYEKHPVSIQAAFEQMQHNYEPKAADKGLLLNIEENPNCNIETDPSHFTRILANLIDNGIKYSNQGSVSVSTKEIEGNKVEISVKDTGIGIPKDQQENVFEEFRQLNNDARNKAKGFGLGLSICKRMANLLGHELRLESDKNGTTITLTAQKTEQIAHEIETEKLDDNFTLEGKTVLIIDDEEDIRDSLRHILEAWEAKVLDAEDKKGAMTIVQYLGDSIDLVISDYRMEGANGVQVINAIHEKAEAKIPNILLTGQLVIDEPDKPDNMRIITKPTSTRKLQSVISEQLLTRKEIVKAEI